MHVRVMWIGLLSVLTVAAGERGVAQARLTVRPREMATGTSNQPGLYVLDSARDEKVYVPELCKGAQRCPLVVVQDPVPFKFFVTGADQYGMILLRTIDIDRRLKEVLGRFAINPDKIALTGMSSSGRNALIVGLSNEDIFSRIAVLSAENPPPHRVFEGPRNPATEFYLAGGIRDMHALTPLALVPYLRSEGHPLKQVTGFYDHEHYAEQYALLVRWLHDSWTTADPAARPAPAVVFDTLQPLTITFTYRLADFWRRFRRQPDSVQAAARTQYVHEVSFPVGRERLSAVMMDVGALAEHYPSIAYDFRDSFFGFPDFKPKDFDGLRAALLSASLVLTVERHYHDKGETEKTALSLFQAADTASSSTLGANVAFLRQALVDQDLGILELEAEKMWTTP